MITKDFDFLEKILNLKQIKSLHSLSTFTQNPWAFTPGGSGLKQGMAGLCLPGRNIYLYCKRNCVSLWRSNIAFHSGNESRCKEF